MKLKDLKTGEEAWSQFDSSIFWWSRGNGSCDCNRALDFDESVDDELNFEFGDLCYGSKRFVAVDVSGGLEGESKESVLALVNQEYEVKS